MTVSTVADLLPPVDVAQASYHLAELHRGAPGFMSLVLLANGRRERHGFIAVEEAMRPVHATQVADSTAALQEVVDQRWNVYSACSTFRELPEKGRGTRNDVVSVPGVWADLDVKPGTEGYFQDEAECVYYMQRLLPPTLEIATGSGGRHLYWLVKPDERLDAVNGQTLLTWWLDFMRVEADGSMIENVHDTPRILRLAGTVRWPKENDQQVTMPRRVELLRTGPRYHVGELLDLASAAHEQMQAERDELQRRRNAEDLHRRQLLEDQGLPMTVFDNYVRRFNVIQDWEPLLLKAGWTLFSDQRGGPARCRYWVRPGKTMTDGKSASTDYVMDDGTVSSRMSIFSRDPSVISLWENSGTNDSRGICSKYWFARVNFYDGDDQALLNAIVQGSGVLM
jgi:hypothetical protein